LAVVQPLLRSFPSEIQSAADSAGPWTHQDTTTTTRGVEVNSFTSGQRTWIRVRAVGAEGDGPWSDLAVKIVP
jgi:hypothetical protein